MAGTVVFSSKTDHNKGYAVLTAAWTADADDASVPDTPLPVDFLESVKGWYLYEMDTKPGEGGEAPTDEYAVTLEDEWGMDILGGAGSGRQAAAAERAMPLWGTDPLPVPVYTSSLTLKIAGNEVDEATGEIKFIFMARGGK